MADENLRDLEARVRAGGDEADRSALAAARARAGLPPLWGYAPRWCTGGTGIPPHLPGSQGPTGCDPCERAREEAAGHVKRLDAPTNGSRWNLRARLWVALVARVAAGMSPRDVRAALREVRPSKHDAAITRQWFSREAVRAFPFLGRKKPLKAHWTGEAPLFGEVPRG